MGNQSLLSVSFPGSYEVDSFLKHGVLPQAHEAVGSRDTSSELSGLVNIPLLRLVILGSLFQ